MDQAVFENRGFEYGVIHWRSICSGRLRDQLLESLALSPEKLRELHDLGAIYEKTQRLENWEKLEAISPAETYLRIHTRPRRFAVPDDLTECVVFEDPEFLVVKKPAGLPCHPTVDNKNENLVSALSLRRREFLFITHRLDVGTQGLMVLARTKKFQKFFNQALAEGKVKKFYRARVDNAPPWKPGHELTHYMKPSPRAPKELCEKNQQGWLQCRLRILKIEGLDLTIELLTGRTHQIRAQLGFVGFPLQGDLAYGSQFLGDFELQSCEISFTDERGKFREFKR